MWNLSGDKEESARFVTETFQSMLSEIPQIKSLEVGRNLPSEYSNRELVLITHHESFEELLAYQTHPFHEGVKEKVRPYLTDRAGADFEAET